MNRIAEEVERDPIYRAIIYAHRRESEATGADAIDAAVGRSRRRRSCREQRRRSADALKCLFDGRSPWLEVAPPRSPTSSSSAPAS